MFKLATYSCAGVPQGSILGPLIYINDLPDGLKSNLKLFADDTSLFSVVKNKEQSVSDLTNDLDMISKWAYNWKMSFNPDKAAVAITGAIHGTSQEKRLEELGLETLKSRRWLRRLLYVQNNKYWYTQTPYRSYS